MISPGKTRGHLRALYQSTTVRATLIFALAGVANTLGNLLLARQLSPAEFGAVALFVALSLIGGSLGPVGADMLVVRHSLRPTPSLLRTVLLAACVVGVISFVAGSAAYSMGLALSAVTFIGVLSVSVGRIDAAFFQSRQKFRMSLFLHQSYNYILFGAGVCAVAAGAGGALAVSAVMAVCFVALAVWGWRSARRAYAAPHEPPTAYPWTEARPIIAAATAIVLLVQIERLLIPQLLSVEGLAHFTVLASLAGSPFHMLMMGVGYTMLPRLKNSKSLELSRRIVRQELLLVSAAAIASAVLVLAFAPLLAQFFTAGKYVLSVTLVATAVVSGFCKVLSGFVGSVLQALGTTSDLRRLNTSAWLGLAVGALASIPAARFGGLPGLVLAAGLGWFVRSVVLIPAAAATLGLRLGIAGR